MIYKGKTYSTFGEVFNLGLKLAKENNEEAQEFFKEYIKYIVTCNNCSIDEAIDIAKRNFGYFAGYYSQDVCDIIYKTYGTSHPIFGDKPFEVSPEKAYQTGLEIGKKL